MLVRLSILAAAALVGAAACGDSSSPEEPPISETKCSELQIAEPALRSQSQCGPTLDFTPINAYQGEIPAVRDREDAVVLVQGSCTGTLIAAQAGPVVLTAGHCGKRDDRVILAFNVEADPDGDELVTEGTVIEQSGEPDYALIQPDRLPAVTPTLLTTQPSDRLAVIQHPRGAPKSVAEGRFAGACGARIYYADLDTVVGSSGAGVLNRQGHLVGIHTDGDCAKDGSGSNYGSTAASIVQASSYLQDVDIGAR